MNQTTRNVLGWVVTLLVPLALVLTSVRVMLHPWYFNWEYRRASFPADRYGFTLEERLVYAHSALDYLLNPAGIAFLGDLRFPDGTPVYNQRELGHMVDVKNTVQAALWVWYASLGALLLLGVWAWRGAWKLGYQRGLGRGGWLTVILLGVLIGLVLTSFGVVFVYFHNVFFDPGTWVFNYSDTLIRLFPEMFWRDIFIIVGLLSLAGGLALGLVFRKK
jgi:integral membrane protein (TIGR01906 family)